MVPVLVNIELQSMFVHTQKQVINDSLLLQEKKTYSKLLGPMLSKFSFINMGNKSTIFVISINNGINEERRMLSRKKKLFEIKH